MRLLLDTHALAWWLQDSAKLGKTARSSMMDDANTLYVSAVSAVEVTTKFRLGKWPEVEHLALNFIALIENEGFLQLPISLAHAGLAGSLLQDHKDPFDRLLAAQAIIEKLPIISADPALDQFGITRIW